MAALVAVLLSLTLFVGGAASQEAIGSSIGGTMRTPPADDVPPEPIGGVRFEVSLGGEEIGEDDPLGDGGGGSSVGDRFDHIADLFANGSRSASPWPWRPSASR